MLKIWRSTSLDCLLFFFNNHVLRLYKFIFPPIGTNGQSNVKLLDNLDYLLINQSICCLLFNLRVLWETCSRAVASMLGWWWRRFTYLFAHWQITAEIASISSRSERSCQLVTQKGALMLQHWYELLENNNTNIAKTIKLCYLDSFCGFTSSPDFYFPSSFYDILTKEQEGQ